tara:strand:- start:56 stop:820 length:765 start_codon:yes stop_codon:yes gene_type:complete
MQEKTKISTRTMHLPFSVPILQFNLEQPYIDMVNENADEVMASELKLALKNKGSYMYTDTNSLSPLIDEEVWSRCLGDYSLLDYMRIAGNYYMDQIYSHIPNEPNSYRRESPNFPTPFHQMKDGQSLNPIVESDPFINFTFRNHELFVSNSWIVNCVAGSLISRPHAHYGHISCAGWLKVPDCIENNDGSDMGGWFEFIYGSPQTFMDFKYPIKPEVGKFAMFPSWLPHTVYPFRGKGLRRTLAFNFVLRNKPK